MRLLKPRAAALALFLAAAFARGAAALEPDELRLGMTELEAVSVYTRYRSCENIPLEESPGRLAWAATLYGRAARVELGLDSGRLASLAFRFPLGAGEGGSELFEALLAEKTAELGPPAKGDATSAFWQGAGRYAALERVETGEGPEIRLSIAARR